MRGGRAVVPAERGATRIADRVVAKIASRAALEALSGTAPPEDHEPPRASVVVHDGSARVRVLVELDYPADIGARCRAVRERIAERVGELTGMEVPEVVITVERLHSAHTGRTAGVRVR
ncbi:Asp23/Gls24 family envelope stress response protein [Streptomyces sp. NPDC001678]|uniref:Asp23/Gls24 family envelope stress response protein n=1 Tax=Streptomyces sp. NPDC001678 TaxID=3364599 RepID=UPI0036C0CDC9